MFREEPEVCNVYIFSVVCSLRAVLADSLVCARSLPVHLAAVLPFRIIGIAVEGVFALLRAIFLLPARLLAAPGKL